LPRGAEVDLPFWMVPKLYEQNMVAPKMPECFDERAWMVIDAEPRNVPLREFCPHFFEFGARLNTLLRDDDFGKALEKAFLLRYRGLLVEAHSTSDVKWRHLLAKEEEALFNVGRESMKAFNTWKYSTREKLEVAAQVRAQKRRRAAGGGKAGAGAAGKENKAGRAEKSSRRT
jgi:GINS complex subunit 3